MPKLRPFPAIPEHTRNAFRFVFVKVQSGAERAVKKEIAREHPELRFAFSRPGFVTFRSSEDLASDFVLRTVFARTWGFSLGKFTRQRRLAACTRGMAAHWRAAAG